MAYETYSEILKLVRDWSNRSDMSDETLYNFIYFAGNMANQMIRVPAMENTVILEVSPEGHINIPSDFLELRSLTARYNQQDSVPLERIAWDQFINYKNLDNQPRDAQYYARQGPFWFLSPQPEVGSKVTCHYYRAMPDISPTEPENWLTNMSPMTYVFGSLHYLYMYVMDDERADYWLKRFEGELMRLQLLADSAEYRGTSITVRSRSQDHDGEL